MKIALVTSLGVVFRPTYIVENNIKLCCGDDLANISNQSAVDRKAPMCKFGLQDIYPAKDQIQRFFDAISAHEHRWPS